MGNKHTNVVTAHIGGLGTDCQVSQRGAIGGLAVGDLVLATVGHGVGELHVIIDSLVYLNIGQN